MTADSVVFRDRVRVDLVGEVAEVWLDRPGSMNALDSAMMAGLLEALEFVAQSNAQAVVLAGEGRAFCAGLDMSFFGTSDDTPALPDLAVRTHGHANIPQKIAIGWRELAVPVFCAIHGVALGGGLQIAAGADFRFIAPDARMSILEMKWGMIPDMAGLVTLGTLVRDDLLRELVFTGRMVDATEAVAIGLAGRVTDDPVAAARAAAQAAVGRSPSALATAKRLLNLTALRHQAELLLAESVEQMALLGGEDFREALNAAIGKRAPAFPKRRVGEAN
ncbi:crotonase/enoyl-CoA hydratase family protein [Novosphingobium sp. 9U]|uniref:crotonase/enoyl-CoA hydratase family protein n=1 Tax=Novosphingobium sp. 9U TaxID=2653158 RepID=UPI0012F206B4|nr:crotonase/enoyl-CoA hydratase family protein [Novosphingobium sp. 9U]VWX50292.1 Enoyl-CoA hydratase [Novosphingobium sp. 9U]